MEETPRPRVLLAGATGFVGRHAYPALRAAGYAVRCGSRDPVRAAAAEGDREWVYLDMEDEHSLRPAMTGCDAVLYLVHQMDRGPGYGEREAQAARWLSRAAHDAGVGRIVYLGGVAPAGVAADVPSAVDAGAASPHLKSRLRTGACLREGPVPAIELRAGMIIGDGSASWTIVRDLAARLPAMLLPRWLKNRSSPVSIDDVVAALLWALQRGPERSCWLELPGPELLSHRVLLERVARMLGKRPAIVEVPVVTPELSSYWIALVTRTRLALARELVRGLQSDLIPSGPSVWDAYTERVPLSLETAAEYALRDELGASTAGERLRAIGLRFAPGQPA